MSNQIITSLLDTDLYKFTMGQQIFHRYSSAWTKFKFKCRASVNLAKYLDEINHELDLLCNVTLSSDEQKYLGSLPYFKSDYIDFLKSLKLNRQHITANLDSSGELEIIAEGPWLQVTWFELFTLSIVQEVYTRNEIANPDFTIAREKLNNKIELANNCPVDLNISDFGTRRRFSGAWHREVIETIVNSQPTFFAGTSNVLFAKDYGIKPIGTFAHELYMGCMGLYPELDKIQTHTLLDWGAEYKGQLSVALSDIFGFRAFLKEFDKFFASMYAGVRHDSGSPDVWCDMLIDHYNKLNIDPRRKTAVFSDGLTFESAIELAIKYNDIIKTFFGIGTSLTHDTGLVKALPLVMKMIECNGKPVAKLSDSNGKDMCEDRSFVELLKTTYNYEPIG